MNQNEQQPERTAMQEALSEVEAIRLEQKSIWKNDPKLSGYPVDILDAVFAVVKMKLKELVTTEKNQWSKAYAQGILVYHPDPCECFSCVIGREGQGQRAYNEKYGTDGK